MMDLEESLRALYYMPVPLLVLNNNRTIKMLNRSAESYFKITSGRCIGQRLEQFLHPTSHSHYISSINESLKTAMESTPGLTRPVATRLRLKQSEKATDHEWAEFTISTWFPTDPAVGSANTPSSTSSYEVASQPSSNTSLTAASRISHESLYSISIAPCPKVDNLQATKIAESKTPSSILSLKEAVFDHMDLAVLALSKDGKTEIRNKACVDLFTSFQRPEADQMDVDMFQEEDILPWAKSSLTFYDEHFDQPFSDGEWPIYYAAILGIASPTVAVGSECKATGVRKILEITPKAIRDRGSYGEHIGGLCSFRDISAERKMLQQEAEHQSEVQLRNTLNKLPHLNWQSTPEGFVDFYSLSFLEYAGLPYSQMEGSGWVSTMKE
jgi:PAS domain-containing protein